MTTPWRPDDAAARLEKALVGVRDVEELRRVLQAHLDAAFEAGRQARGRLPTAGEFIETPPPRGRPGNPWRG